MTVNPEKIPDAPRYAVTYAGVDVWSRWGKRRELEVMMLDHVFEREPSRARLIVQLFCDSPGCGTYTVECRGHATEQDLHAIGGALEEAFLERDGGHQGITLEAGQGGGSVSV